MKPARRLVSRLHFLAALFIASPAFAGDPAAAQVLFEEGRALARNGDWSGACEKFTESQRLDPAPGTMLNIAHCEVELGRLASAWEHFHAALDTLPPDDERIEHARSQLAELEPRVPRLKIVTRSKAIRVERDGVELGVASLGVALPVDPGKHVVTASAPGRPPRSYTIVLAEAAHETLEVEPESPARAAVTPQKPGIRPVLEASDSSTKRTAGFVIGGVGVGALGIGFVSGALALGKKNEVRDHCDTDYACDDRGVDAARNGKRWATVSTIAFVVGLGGVAAGSYLIWTSSGRRSASLAIGGVGSGAGAHFARSF